jgi:glycosyltransferase involved in cell wall biosynthesis
VPDVLYVSSNSGLGGAEAVLQTLVEAHPGPVIALEDGPLVRELRERGLDVGVVSAPRGVGMLRGAWALRRRLRMRAPDVVHANGLKAALVAGAAACGLRVRVVWMKHDTVGDGALAALAALLCAEVVGVSDTVLRTFRGPLSRRTVRVYNGLPDRAIDRGTARRRVAAVLGRDPAGPVVVLSGRLCPGKGQHELLRAAPAILEALPTTTFLLLGGEDPAFPGHAETLRREAVELGVADAVVLAGRREDAVELVAGCDLLAAPSVTDPWGWQEGFGLAVAEAMQVGTPVVAYASGSLPEVLGGAGRLVGEGDTANLARAIVDLLQSGTERERLAAAGRARVARHFRLDDALAGMAARHRALAGHETGRERPGWRGHR